LRELIHAHENVQAGEFYHFKNTLIIIIDRTIESRCNIGSSSSVVRSDRFALITRTEGENIEIGNVEIDLRY